MIIEVQRTDDDSTQQFDSADIGSGAVVNFVTQNSSSADGLVQFLNQSAPTGNTAAPADLRGKIVENGSLVTDASGNPAVKWDGVDDGYEFDIASTDALSSSSRQSVALKLSPDDLKGKPQTLIESDGLRVWSQGDEIVATIATSDPGWRRWSSVSGQTTPSPASYLENAISYKGNLWGLNGDSTSKAIFWDGSSWTESTTFSGYADAMGIYDGDLYVSIQNGDMFRYDGSSWSQPHTASSGYYESMVVYNDNLFLSNSGNNTVTRYDGSTWEEEFIDAASPPSGSNITDPTSPFFHGLCVHEGKLYVPTDVSPPTEIWSYDPTNGVQLQAAVDTSGNGSAGNTFNGCWALGSYDGQLVMGTQSGQFWTYDEDAGTWNFQGLACSYLISFREFGGDLYIGGDFGFYASDGVWKWDGSTLEKDLDDSEFDSNSSNGPFRFVNTWKGTLISHHRYVADTLVQKGQGAETRVTFDQSADEIVIEAGVSANTLALNVNGSTSATSYDFNYDQDGSVRIGLDQGSVTAGGKSNMDEPYSGTFKALQRFPLVTDGIKSVALKSATGPTVSSTGVTTSSVSGTLDFGDPSVAEEYEVLFATQQGGPYQSLETFTKTEIADLPQSVDWTHEGLSSSTTYYYIGRVRGGGTTVESSEISVTTN